MGRAPCCDKANVKKGPWSPEEDAKLKSYIEQHGTGGNWIALPHKMGLKRCGKSCRLRWLNYLRPNIKHGAFSEEEDNLICSLYISIGSRWSIIAAQLPGRTDNDIKNYWNTRLKKKLFGKQRRGQNYNRKGNAFKQEITARESNFMPILSAASSNQALNWPELPLLAAPIPYSNEEARLNDQASIRKLLIKLGGRFSEEDHNPIRKAPTPTSIDQGMVFNTTQIHDQSLNSLPSCPSSDTLINDYNMPCNFDGVAGLQDQNYHVPLLGFDEIGYNSQRVEGIDSFNEISSLVYNNNASVGTNCEGSMHQKLIQDYVFYQDLSYLG